MDKQVWIAITFIAFLLSFTVVGICSTTQKQNTTTDYLVASRNVNPWLTALSAMATGQSGFLFIGQVGFAYKLGVSSLWLTIGWLIGDYLAWWFIFRRLRQISLVTFSWSALASGLGSLLVLRVWQRLVNLPTAIAMMGVGIKILWQNVYYFLFNED